MKRGFTLENTLSSLIFSFSIREIFLTSVLGRSRSLSEDENKVGVFSSLIRILNKSKHDLN